MKVLLLAEMSGTRDGQAWPPRGTVVDLPDDEAARLCELFMARPVVETEMVEKAVLVAPEVEVRGVEVRGDGPLTTKNGPALRRKG